MKEVDFQMKKYLALLLVLVMVLSLAACASKPAETTDEPEQTTTEPAPAEETKDEEPAPAEETKEEETTEEPADNTEYAVAMITDYGDITDQSFNQTTYEACKAFCEDNGVEFSYFKPAGDNTADRVAMIEKAVDEGYNVIVMPGYAFGGAIVEAAPEFPEVKFIALDVAKGDLLEAGVAKAGESYDYNPDNWDLEKYVDMSNVYCAIYQEELCGYMAGYAAVKLGYKNLGFLGGMAVPAVVRYGYGFVQGVDAAAADLGLSDVTLNYIYGGQFSGDVDITAVMDTWYANGTEVVFACGGGIYTSAVDAAKKANGKVIGVDVDQAGVIANYAGVDGLTVTSAMKGLYPATYDTLNDVIINGNWANYVGKIATLGLVSADDPEANYVQIPMGEGTQWSDSFTEDDYKAMVADMYNGVITVSNDISKTASDFATVITVDDQGAIKG
jgi:basic membrane protein A